MSTINTSVFVAAAQAGMSRPPGRRHHKTRLLHGKLSFPRPCPQLRTQIPLLEISPAWDDFWTHPYSQGHTPPPQHYNHAANQPHIWSLTMSGLRTPQRRLSWPPAPRAPLLPAPPAGGSGPGAPPGPAAGWLCRTCLRQRRQQQGTGGGVAAGRRGSSWHWAHGPQRHWPSVLLSRRKACTKAGWPGC